MKRPSPWDYKIKIKSALAEKVTNEDCLRAPLAPEGESSAQV
ncbi:MAG: hypothetical protein PHU27_08715 [Salinivirgaceae bacterium]|nr:hypothetical protein [Salinivirgaceae bacterium]